MAVALLLAASASALHPPSPLCGTCGTAPQAPSSSRRQLLGRAALLGCGCGVCGGAPLPAAALAALRSVDSPFDVTRDSKADKAFARGMATGMADYERAVRDTKAELFSRLFAKLPASDSVVVELGMGSFPNAPFYAAGNAVDIVGVDPNDYMAEYAQAAANRAGLAARGTSVRTVHGVGEALPLADASADAVVCTLTLCSVPEPAQTLAEVRRVLKPGGRFLFVEHVLSETDDSLAAMQRALTPLQVRSADGCHLDRRTLQTVQAAGFASVDARYFELEGFLYLNPTVAGVAIR